MPPKEFKVKLVNTVRYTKESLEKAIEDFNKRCPVFGEVMPYYLPRLHPTQFRQVYSSNIGFVTTELAWEGDNVVASVKPCGPLAERLDENPPPGVGFAIRGLSKMRRQTDDSIITDLDQLITIDYVFHGQSDAVYNDGPFKTIHGITPMSEVNVTTPPPANGFTIPELIANVVQWSKDRGIIPNATVLAQVGKYYEESGELAAGVNKKKHDLLVDGIGDALVVLTNVLVLAGDDLGRFIENWDDLPYGLGNENGPYSSGMLLHKHQLYTALLFDQYLEGEGINADDVYYVITCLNTVAVEAGVTLRHCFNVAWEEIKDRKGFLTPEGVFVKEADA